VRVSGDDSETWPVAIAVEAGPATYSYLAPLPGGRVELLDERGRSAHIRFTVLPIPWPGGPRDDRAPGHGP
jgi:hypothetical protein